METSPIKVTDTVVARPADLTEDAREKLEQYIEEEEGAFNRLGGWIGAAITAAAVFVSLFHLYAAYDIVPAHVLRPTHVGMVLVLCYLLFPMARRFRDRIRWWDYLLAVASAGTIVYVLYQGAYFGDRATMPTVPDYYVGVAFVVLLLEATRRATGWIMPGVAIAFLLYAIFGNHLPAPWTHRGYALEDLVAHLYMTLEGVFGVTVDVASSLIILFTVFGAILQHSGAGRFFIDFSFAAMGGRRNAAGRAVVLSSFLLGGPSGSGVATTVTIGTVAHPLLAKAGYEKNAAGGLLAAAGLGAIISPPVLGAAAFLIAEFLKISYFDVILMATIPTVLYYLAILVMVEIDSHKSGGAGELMVPKGALWTLTKGYWFHFGSLISIIAFMLLGFSPVLAVFWATILAIAVSTLRSDTAVVPVLVVFPLVLCLGNVLLGLLGLPASALVTEYAWLLVFVPLVGVAVVGLAAPQASPTSQRFVQAMRDGTTGVLNVAATCATAGIIVGVVTLTAAPQAFARARIELEGGGEAVGHGVGDGDELHVERPDLAALAIGHGDQLGLAEEPRLLDAVARQPQRERGAVDREGEIAQQERQPADVVFVAMRGDHADQAMGVLAQPREVREDEVDAEVLELREHQPAIEHQELVLALQDHAVAADLAQAAEIGDGDGFSHVGRTYWRSVRSAQCAKPLEHGPGFGFETLRFRTDRQAAGPGRQPHAAQGHLDGEGELCDLAALVGEGLEEGGVELLGAVDVALLGALADRLTLVVELLALSEGDLDLDPRALEVQLHRHDRHPALTDPAVELRQLVMVQQQPAIPHGLVVLPVRLHVVRDVAPDERGAVLVDPDPCLGEVGVPGP